MAARLKEQLSKPPYKNNVEIFGAPDELTLFGFYTKTPEGHFEEYRAYCTELIPHVKSLFPNSVIIDLHATPASRMLIPVPGQNPKTNLSRIGKWRAAENELGNFSFKGQLELRQTNLEGVYLVEMPAAYRPAGQGFRSLAPKDAFHQEHFIHVADLKKSKRSNYLQPEVVSKLAHLINQRVKTDLHIYRAPRRESHRKRVFRPWNQLREDILAGRAKLPPREQAQKERIARKLAKSRRVR